MTVNISLKLDFFSHSSTTKERDTKNVFEQYQRILVVIEYASRKRTELEKRMADAYADKSLSYAQLETVISVSVWDRLLVLNCADDLSWYKHYNLSSK